MTRPSSSDLVLDGNEVKLRLKAERSHSRQHVHVDWVRFTANLRWAPMPSVEDLFPKHQGARWSDELQHLDHYARLSAILRELPDSEFAASAQAKELAQRACEALGPDFSVYPELRKGHDFYRFRWSIVRGETECGWVGFLSSGSSPRQQAQGKTIHCNIYGTACTFASRGWNLRLANLCDEVQATITRCDLALDFFDGFTGGLHRVVADYVSGLMDHFRKRPSCNSVGDWCNERGGKGKSFYWGSKEAGKQTNAYEKGLQLFGPQDRSNWVRFELRYGNKLRDLPSDILRRPTDFFSGASDYHAALVREAEAHATPEPVKTRPRLALETVLAECTRNARWVRDTAAASLGLALQYLDIDELRDMAMHAKLPGRLQKFTQAEVSAAYGQAVQRIKGSGYGRVGLQPV